MTRACCTALLLLLAGAARALAPHECLVLVNTNSADSAEVANWFIHLRGVPEGNVVRLGLDPVDHKLSIGTNGWRRIIRDGVEQALARRGHDAPVHAWIYSAGFPPAVRTNPEMSITGFTFTRGEVPPEHVIKSGQYLSPYFAGPAVAKGAAGPTAGFRSRRRALGPAAPMPAMMLGFTGRNGNTVATVLDTLRRGAASDRTRPAGEVWFLFQDDIRWSCREWQVQPAMEELQALGRGARIVNGLKRGAPPLAGFMTGAQRVDLDRVPPFAPGALAEHLTSFGAHFPDNAQMKSTAWLGHGATGTAGTITEPYAIWSKFPHARSFVHQAAGCTLIESLQQGLACPFQSLPLGEPLANPFAAPRTLAVRTARRDGAVAVRAEARPFDAPLEFELLVDGRPHGRVNGTGEWTLPEAELGPGHHELQVVASTDDPVGQAVWTTVALDLPHPAARLSIAGAAERMAAGQAELTVRAEGLAGEVELFCQGLSVGRKTAAAEVPFTVTRAAAGRGPLRVQAVTRVNGRPLRSAPLLLRME